MIACLDSRVTLGTYVTALILPWSIGTIDASTARVQSDAQLAQRPASSGAGLSNPQAIQQFGDPSAQTDGGLFARVSDPGRQGGR